MKTLLAEPLTALASGRDLSSAESAAAVSAIMSGEASEVEIAAFLTALRIKGETADELAGAVEAVLSRVVGWESTGLPTGRVLDTCGTGGDGANTVNVSTATAIVVAACGVPVTKHGNRSASGNSGSAEVLAELGVDVEAPLSVLQRCLADAGVTFLFAPRFHPALKHAGPVRRQLPFRTLFNLIGPLANPARPAYQLVGVAGDRQAELMATVLSRQGLKRAAVVTGADGLDEVTLDGATRVRWIEDGTVRSFVWQPEDFGLPRTSAAELRVSGPPESAARILEMLAGANTPARAAIVANSAAALLVAGGVRSLAEGVATASAAIDSGKARQTLDKWREVSRTPAEI